RYIQKDHQSRGTVWQSVVLSGIRVDGRVVKALVYVSHCVCSKRFILKSRLLLTSNESHLYAVGFVSCLYMVVPNQLLEAVFHLNPVCVYWWAGFLLENHFSCV